MTILTSARGSDSRPYIQIKQYDTEADIIRDMSIDDAIGSRPMDVRWSEDLKTFMVVSDRILEGGGPIDDDLTLSHLFISGDGSTGVALSTIESRLRIYRKNAKRQFREVANIAINNGSANTMGDLANVSYDGEFVVYKQYADGSSTVASTNTVVLAYDGVTYNEVKRYNASYFHVVIRGNRMFLGGNVASSWVGVFYVDLGYTMGNLQTLNETMRVQRPMDVTSDGKVLLYACDNPTTRQSYLTYVEFGSGAPLVNQILIGIAPAYSNPIILKDGVSVWVLAKLDDPYANMTLRRYTISRGTGLAWVDNTRVSYDYRAPTSYTSIGVSNWRLSTAKAKKNTHHEVILTTYRAVEASYEAAPVVSLQAAYINRVGLPPMLAWRRTNNAGEGPVPIPIWVSDTEVLIGAAQGWSTPLQLLRLSNIPDTGTTGVVANLNLTPYPFYPPYYGTPVRAAISDNFDENFFLGSPQINHFVLYGGAGGAGSPGALGTYISLFREDAAGTGYELVNQIAHPVGAQVLHPMFRGETGDALSYFLKSGLITGRYVCDTVPDFAPSGQVLDPSFIDSYLDYGWDAYFAATYDKADLSDDALVLYRFDNVDMSFSELHRVQCDFGPLAVSFCWDIMVANGPLENPFTHYKRVGNEIVKQPPFEAGWLEEYGRVTAITALEDCSGWVIVTEEDKLIVIDEEGEVQDEIDLGEGKPAGPGGSAPPPASGVTIKNGVVVVTYPQSYGGVGQAGWGNWNRSPSRNTGYKGNGNWEGMSGGSGEQGGMGSGAAIPVEGAPAGQLVMPYRVPRVVINVSYDR